jgi:probable rRNA maturation factor
MSLSDKSVMFFFEDVSFTFQKRTLIRSWLQRVAKKESKSISALNYVFCSDEYLLSMNKEHLQHDTYTDIITFGYSAKNSPEITGDIFISIDRVKENAKTYSTNFQNELRRVMSHGLLHLCGYKDKNKADKEIMRTKEDAALSTYKSMDK